MNLNEAKNILVIGIAGGLARITTNLLNKNYPHINVIGVDSRKIEFQENTENLKIVRMKYTRSNFENIFREHDFDGVIHLGRTSHANANPLGTLAKRLDLNVLGTRRVLDLCLQYEVKKVTNGGVLFETSEKEHVFMDYDDLIDDLSNRALISQDEVEVEE